MGYRASATKGSRKVGSSASAKHAYHQREGGYASGLEGKREDLADFGSGNLPDWTGGNPALFWDATDSYERANGSLFKDLQLNLPAELTLEQNRQIIEAYAHRMFSAERLPYSWAIHVENNGADLNHHAHLMVSERMTDDIQRTAATHFKRHDRAKPEAGGALKTRTLKPKSWLMEARAAWAEAVNTGLVAAGYAPRFDHRSKEDQREAAFLRGDLRRVAELSTLTQVHEGPRIAGMRRRVEAGERTLASLPDYAQEIIQGNDAIREQNAAFLSLLESLDDSQVAELLAEELIERLHTEALVLDAVFDAHTEALTLDAVFEDAAFHALVDTALEEWGDPVEWPEFVELPGAMVIDQKARLEADRRRRERQQAEELELELQLKAEADQRRAELMAMLTELEQVCGIALELGFPPEVETFRGLVSDWLRAPDACPHTLEKLIATRDELHESVELRKAEEQQQIQAETEDGDFWASFAEAEAHYEKSMSDEGWVYTDVESAHDEPELADEAESTAQAETEPEPEPDPAPRPRGPRPG